MLLIDPSYWEDAARAANRREKAQGQLGHFDLARGPHPMRSKYSKRTVTSIQQSGRYSVDNYTGTYC